MRVPNRELNTLVDRLIGAFVERVNVASELEFVVSRPIWLITAISLATGANGVRQ